MAPLTWRNVATPNMGDPVDAMRLSGTLLDRGFTGFNESLSRFSNWQDDQNARLVGDAALRIQDPAQLREALANGTLLSGMPGGSLTPAAMEALQGRAGTLLAQSQAQENLSHSVLHNPQVRRQADATLAGTEANTAQTRQTTDQQGQLFPHRLGEAQRNTEAGVTAQPYRLEGINREGQAARDNETAANVMRERQLDIATVEGARAYIGSPEFQALSPGAQRAVQAAISQQYPTAFAPVGVPGAGSGAVAAAATGPQAQPRVGAGGTTPVAGAIAEAAGGGPRLVPDESGSIAARIPFRETREYVQNITAQARAANGGALPTGTNEQIADALIPHVTRQESGGRQEATSTAGARGVMQLMPDTAAELERRLGMAPGLTRQNTPEGRAANLQAGRQYLIDQLAANGGNVELALAAYNAGPGRVSQWQRGEGTSPTGRAQEAFRRADDISLEQDRLGGQNRRGSLIPRMREAANSQESAAEVAARVRTSFPDEESGRINAELTRLVNGGLGPGGRNLTYAEAGLIMQQGLSTREGRHPATSKNTNRFWGDSRGEAPSVGTFDAAANDTLARQYASGDLHQVERASRDLDENRTALATARQRAQAAYDRVAALRAQVAGGRPQLQGELDRAERSLETATDSLHTVNQRLTSARARVSATSNPRARDAAGAIADAAGERGPTRGSQVSEAAGGRGTQRAAPEVRASGPRGTARPGTIPRARRIEGYDEAPGPLADQITGTEAGNRAREEIARAGMFNPEAAGGRQADETGVNQASLGLGLLATAAGGGAGAIRHGYNMFRYGRYMLPEITIASPGVGGAAGTAAGRIAGTTAAEAAGQAAAQTPARLLLSAPGRVAPPSPTVPPNVIHMGARPQPPMPSTPPNVIPMGQSAGSRAGEILQAVVRGTQGGAPIEQAIAAAARQYGIAPETIARAVRAASGR